MNRVIWSAAGALTSAATAAATIFCCLPFATGIIGASMAAYGARVAFLQPYLQAVSAVLLGYAFFQAYRRDATCAPGGTCQPWPYRRAVVWVVAVMVVGFLTAPLWADRVIFWTL